MTSLQNGPICMHGSYRGKKDIVGVNQHIGAEDVDCIVHLFRRSIAACSLKAQNRVTSVIDFAL